MDRRFREATVTSGASRALVDKYKDDPTIKRLEDTKALIQAGKDAGAAKRAEADLIRAENQKIADSYDATNAAMSAAADGAITFGINTAAGIAQALIAGRAWGACGARPSRTSARSPATPGRP